MLDDTTTQANTGASKVKNSLTKLETTAIIDLWNSSKGNGHDFGYPDDLPSIAKTSRGGVVASLSSKGIIDVYDNSDDNLANQFVFTDNGKSLFVDFNVSATLKGNPAMTTETAAPVKKGTAAVKKTAAPKTPKNDKTAPTKKTPAKKAAPKAEKADKKPAVKKTPAKAAKEPKTDKTPKTDKVAKGNKGPSNLQLSVLKMLAKKGRPMTRAQLSEALEGSFIGGTVMGHKNPDKLMDTSLVGRGLVKFAAPKDENDRGVWYEITAAGRKLVGK